MLILLQNDDLWAAYEVEEIHSLPAGRVELTVRLRRHYWYRPKVYVPDEIFLRPGDKYFIVLDWYTGAKVPVLVSLAAQEMSVG